MKHIYCCGCGENTEVTDRDLMIGAVNQCPRCGQVSGRVMSRSGRTAWIKISDQEVDFYGLLGLRNEEEDGNEANDFFARGEHMPGVTR